MSKLGKPSEEPAPEAEAIKRKLVIQFLQHSKAFLLAISKEEIETLIQLFKEDERFNFEILDANELSKIDHSTREGSDKIESLAEKDVIILNVDLNNKEQEYALGRFRSGKATNDTKQILIVEPGLDTQVPHYDHPCGNWTVALD